LLAEKQNGRISARRTFAIRKLHHSDFKEALILMVNYVIERKKKIINVLKGFFSYESEILVPSFSLR
jgi:hypothetical protein